MRINQAGINLIKSFESCKLRAYQDLVGIWTIGWGHTGDDVYDGRVISQEAADNLLLSDLSKFEWGVNHYVSHTLTDNEFSALVCFTYNVGLGNFKKSNLLSLLNFGHLKEAADEFLKWNHANGKVVDGLTRRREAERDLFLK